MPPTSRPASGRTQQSYISPAIPLAVRSQAVMLSPTLYSVVRPVPTPISSSASPTAYSAPPASRNSEASANQNVSPLPHRAEYPILSLSKASRLMPPAGANIT